MPVALTDFCFSIGLESKGAGFKFAGPRAEAHGAAHLVDTEQLAQLVNNTVGRLGVKLRAVRLGEARKIASVFDGGALHAEADAEEGNFVFAGELNGVDHALNAALAESARNQDAVVIFEALFRAFKGVDFFGLDPVNNSFVMMGEAAVEERLAKAFIGVFK